jgi:hypothetical protein
MPWKVRSVSGVMHIIPTEDVEPHFEIPDCHCHPERHPETTADVIVHNSFDRRELAEPNHAEREYRA